MRKYLKNIINSNITLKRFYFAVMVLLNKGYYIKNPNKVLFDGWGMVTVTKPAWTDSEVCNAVQFKSVNSRIIKLIQNHKLLLSQFNQKAVLTELAQLQWRHYIVYTSVFLAIKAIGKKKFIAVELGVCDGLTAAYAINAIIDNPKVSGQMILMDAWQAMRDSDLLSAEKGSVGAYSYLSLKNTINNLNNFPFDTKYIKGYIPESLNNPEIPDNIDWLHIDLNSSQPTILALDFFWPKINKGGVVLLDDYGFVGYEDTRLSIDRWSNIHNVILIAIPTGQAILLKT